MVGEVISIGELRGAAATKERILDAAEALFMEHGFEATSLRAITAAAEANLAAVNYHFGSKEELFQAVLTRRLDPMNQDASRCSTRSSASRAPARCPASGSCRRCSSRRCELARDPARGGKNFLRLLGRAYADPAPFIRHFLSEQYAEMIGRFKAAFGRALPQLPKRELSWRLHFIMGALSYTLAGTDALKLIAEIAPRDSTDNDETAAAAPGAVPAGRPAPRRCPTWARHRDARSNDGDPRADPATGIATARRNSPRQPFRTKETTDADAPLVPRPLALLPSRSPTSTRPASPGPSRSPSPLGVAWVAHAAAAVARRSRWPWRSCCSRSRCKVHLAAAQADQRRRPRRVPQDPAADVADRAARRSRPAPSGGTASSSPASPTGASCSPTPPPTLTAEEQRFLDDETEELCEHGHRLGDDQRPPRPAAAGVAVHQGQGLPRA